MPWASSSAPGPSPTKTSSAFGLPTPKTICVRPLHSLHRWQSPISARISSSVRLSAGFARGACERAIADGREEVATLDALAPRVAKAAAAGATEPPGADSQFSGMDVRPSAACHSRCRRTSSSRVLSSGPGGLYDTGLSVSAFLYRAPDHPEQFLQRVSLWRARRGHHRGEEPFALRGPLPQLERGFSGARSRQGRSAESFFARVPGASGRRYGRSQLLRSLQDRSELPHPRVRPCPLGAAIRSEAVAAPLESRPSRVPGGLPRARRSPGTGSRRQPHHPVFGVEEDVRQPTARGEIEALAADERGGRSRARDDPHRRRGPRLRAI